MQSVLDPTHDPDQLGHEEAQGLARERAAVEAMYAEFTFTGKVLQTLPEDEATVRKAHTAEVLRKPLAELDREKPRAVGTAYQAAKEHVAPSSPAGTTQREGEAPAEPHAQDAGRPEDTAQPVQHCLRPKDTPPEQDSPRG